MTEEKIVQYTMNQFPCMTLPQITTLAKDSMSEFFREAELTDPQTAFKAMIIIARIGLEAEFGLSKKQKTLVDANFSSFYKGPLEPIYPMLLGQAVQEEYALVEKLQKQGDRVGIPLLSYLLCFACCDGEPSPKLKAWLEKTFDDMPLVSYQRKNEDTVYQEALAQWKDACAQRSKEYTRRKDLIRQEYLQNLAQTRDATIENQTQRKKEMQMQNRELYEQMQCLGPLQFLKRQKLQSTRDQLESNIRRCDYEISCAKSNYEREKRLADDELQSQYMQLTRDFEKEFPLPPKPKAPTN